MEDKLSLMLIIGLVLCGSNADQSPDSEVHIERDSLGGNEDATVTEDNSQLPMQADNSNSADAPLDRKEVTHESIEEPVKLSTRVPTSEVPMETKEEMPLKTDNIPHSYPDEIAPQETKTDEINHADSVELIDGETKQNAQEVTKTPEAANNETDSNSTFFIWIKNLLEPFIEEFRDGINPKSQETNNQSSLNGTDMNVNLTTEDLTVLNISEPEFSNVTDTELINASDSGKKVKFHCTGRNVTESTNATVKVITTAKLLQLLSFDKNETENVTDCLLVMFYAPWCHFCAKTAPHYNALARAFPQLDFVAVDTAQFSNLLARFGTVSVPNVLVFHQSRAAVKFNQTERTFENFVAFVQNTTGLEPNSTVNVTEADYLGPVPSVPTDDTDYLLLISWIFVIFCSTCMFVKSTKGQQWITRVRVLWQEHQHID